MAVETSESLAHNSTPTKECTTATTSTSVKTGGNTEVTGVTSPVAIQSQSQTMIKGARAVNRDLKALRKQNIFEFEFPDDDDIFVIDFTINCGGLWEGINHTFRANISQNYPFTHPVVTCLDYSNTYHPNIQPSDGSICLGLLTSDGWKAMCTLTDLCIALSGMFFTPNWEHSLNQDVFTSYHDNKNEFYRRLKSLGALNLKSPGEFSPEKKEGSSSIPMEIPTIQNGEGIVSTAIAVTATAGSSAVLSSHENGSSSGKGSSSSSSRSGSGSGSGDNGNSAVDGRKGSSDSNGSDNTNGSAKKKKSDDTQCINGVLGIHITESDTLNPQNLPSSGIETESEVVTVSKGVSSNLRSQSQLKSPVQSQSQLNSVNQNQKNKLSSIATSIASSMATSAMRLIKSNQSGQNNGKKNSGKSCNSGQKQCQEEKESAEELLVLQPISATYSMVMREG